MSAIRDGRYPIMLDRDRHLLFTLNAIDAVQDRFGSIESITDELSGKDGIKNLRWLLTLLLNEGAGDGEEELTERQVGKLIHVGNFNEVKVAIYKAFSVGTSGTDAPAADDDGEIKNVEPSGV